MTCVIIHLHVQNACHLITLRHSQTSNKPCNLLTLGKQGQSEVKSLLTALHRAVSWHPAALEAHASYTMATAHYRMANGPYRVANSPHRLVNGPCSFMHGRDGLQRCIFQGIRRENGSPRGPAGIAHTNRYCPPSLLWLKQQTRHQQCTRKENFGCPTLVWRG